MNRGVKLPLLKEVWKWAWPHTLPIILKLKTAWKIITQQNQMTSWMVVHVSDLLIAKDLLTQITFPGNFWKERMKSSWSSVGSLSNGAERTGTPSPPRDKSCTEFLRKCGIKSLKWSSKKDWMNRKVKKPWMTFWNRKFIRGICSSAWPSWVGATWTLKSI